MIMSVSQPFNQLHLQEVHCVDVYKHKTMLVVHVAKRGDLVKQQIKLMKQFVFILKIYIGYWRTR